MKCALSFGLLAIAAVTLGPVLVAQQIASVRTAARSAARTEAFSTTIQGNALTSTNGQLTQTFVRLRDARYGRIMDTVMTDKSGLFAFHAVDPGNYIVEIMSADQTSVLAASQMLSVNAGDVVSAVVKLPFRLPPFAGILGGQAATPTTAAAVVAQAAANSVLLIAAPPVAADNCNLQHQ